MKRLVRIIYLISLGGGNGQFIITRNKFWKCIGCLLSAVNYGVKGHQIWIKIETYFSKKGITPSHIDIHEKIHLLKVGCYIYRPRYCYDCHELFYHTLFHSFIGCYFECLTLSLLQFMVFPPQGLRSSRSFCHVTSPLCQ